MTVILRNYDSLKTIGRIVSGAQALECFSLRFLHQNLLRKLASESAALAAFTADIQLCLVPDEDVLDNRQPQTGATLFP